MTDPILRVFAYGNTNSFGNTPQGLEIVVRRFQAGAVVSSAGHDDDIGRGNSDASGTSTPGEFVCGAPDVVVDRQAREYPCEVVQHSLFPFAARTVPQLQSNDRAPAGGSGSQRRSDTATGGRVTVRTQQMNP